MPDSDLAGTPDWLDRLRNGAELHGIHYEDCANPEAHWACGCKAVEDTYAAVTALAAATPSPQEGGGRGPTSTPWAEPYGSDPTFLAADEAVTTLARSLCLTASEAECMQRGGHELWRLGWRPAGVQVDREALAAAHANLTAALLMYQLDAYDPYVDDDDESGEGEPRDDEDDDRLPLRADDRDALRTLLAAVAPLLGSAGVAVTTGSDAP